MPWSRNGTVAVTQNSTTVTGTGTTFTSSRNGDAFNGPDGRRYEVANIVSETVLAIIPAYTGATVSGAAYSIEPVQGYPKALTDAFSTVNQRWGSTLAGLGSTGNYDTLPVAKGGTGRSDGRAVFSEVGIQQPSALYNIQGLYMGWNQGSQGEGHFIVNRGGGAGGFTWRSVNGANTASGPSMTYSYEGLLTVPSLYVSSPIGVASGGTGGNSQAAARQGLGLGAASVEDVVPIAKGGTGASSAGNARTALGVGPGQAPTFASIELTNSSPYIDFHYNNSATDYDVRLINQQNGVLRLEGAFQVSGRLESTGTWCRAGLSAGRGGTVYNYNWTGSNVDVWIDNTYVGTMTLFTSDYRIKKFIKTLSDKREMVADSVPSFFLDRIDAYRVVTFQKKKFGDVFSGDGTTYQGLIAHEAQEVNPLAVTGEKDGVDEKGNARIQQLDPMALITDLMGAVKELRAEVIALKAAAQPAPEPAAA
ncbi:peptidase S74 [Pseudomonas congelans]|uniref:tail fiber domain-containing protein n=1 Tax=Pseudomonas congelans TaxID=200452 RepID=UPI000BB63E31|nr:tail fiber domain-containing protein [Pseudomonas congelans]PBQ00346.1 peptidase S74 [Pseudomonas congelans]